MGKAPAGLSLSEHGLAQASLKNKETATNGPNPCNGAGSTLFWT